MNKKYAVTDSGHIMAHFDTRIKDSSRWVIDYQGEFTGAIYQDSSKIGVFDTLNEAVSFSREVRLAILEQEYKHRRYQIMNRNWG